MFTIRLKTIMSLLLVSLFVFVLSACGSKEKIPAAVSASPSTTSATADDLKKKMPSEVRIGYQVIPNAELLTKALGLAEKKFPNIKIKWVQFDSGRDVNTAIASRSIDFGLVGSTGTSVGIANNLPYQVYFIHDLIGDNEALVVRNDSGINSIMDLKGKKVAVPFGSTTHFSLLQALKSEGLKLSEVQILDMQPPDMFAAWQRKDISAGYVWNPVLSKLKNTNGKILLTSKTLSDKGIITADVGIVRKEFADQYPEYVKQYVSVLDEAVQYFATKPNESAEAMSKELNSNPADSLAMMKELVWKNSSEQRDTKLLGVPGAVGSFAEVLKSSADFMTEQKAISSAPALNVYQAAIRNEFLSAK